jgi:RNA polymerase sigma factor (sigma-70 family)
VLLGQLFKEHGRMVLGLCRLLLRNSTDAEDAAQQVFLSAHRAVLRGSRPREAAPWLAAIARNECRARIRARMREPLALPELRSDLPDPLASAISALDLDAVWNAISSLPRRQRRALVLRELGGLSYHELSHALGVSDSSIESLLFRARRQVRRVLAGANAAALPVALREELARLIPGFDPGSAGLVARAAALPIGLKLATAAVGVGAVTTGATQFPQPRAETSHRPAPAVGLVVTRPDALQRPSVRLVSARHSSPVRSLAEAKTPLKVSAVMSKDRKHEDEQQAAESREQEPLDLEPVRETAETEPAEEEKDADGSDGSSPGSSGSDSSGPGRSGSDSSGSDQPGSSGDDSEPGAADD